MTRFFAPAPPRILAHRGLALAAPENSLAAFRAALAAGVGHLETDAHATRDGVAVLWHDPELRRFDGSHVAVAELSWAELRARRGGDGAMCSLAEALEALPDARFNIDVKVAAAARPVARAVVAAGAAGRVLLTSFAESRARAAWREAPGVARGATRERLAAALVAIESHSERLLARALRGIDAVQIPERAAGLTLTSPARLAALRRHVREVHVWTVNDPADMRRLWRAGVDGVVTDRTDLAVAALDGMRGGDEPAPRA